MLWTILALACKSSYDAVAMDLGCIMFLMDLVFHIVFCMAGEIAFDDIQCGFNEFDEDGIVSRLLKDIC